MRVAVGSAHPSKVEAVKEAFQVFGKGLVSHRDEPLEFSHYDLADHGGKIALSTRDLMQRAEQQVDTLILQLKREKAEADYYVGLVEGFNVVDAQGPRRIAFWENWAYASDGHRGSFGHGPGLSVPATLLRPILDRGIDLGIALDRFRADQELQSSEGPFGLLTHDILDRKHSVVMALITAFAPFYNPSAYA